MIDLFKLLKWLKDNKKAGLFVGVAFFVLLIIIVMTSMGGEPTDSKAWHTAERIAHEADRAARVIQLIDDKKEAELDAVKNRSIDGDHVLDALDALLGLHTGK